MLSQPEDNYTIGPLKRFDLDDILSLIQRKRYFALHAPRQTGKTSCLLALRDHLNVQDDYIAVYVNVEGGQAARNNVLSAIRTVCGTIAEKLSLVLGHNQPKEIRKDVNDLDLGGAHLASSLRL